MPNPTCPLDGRKAVDLYFMEHRAKLLDIAAFLGRLALATAPEIDDGAEDVADAAEVIEREALAALLVTNG